MRRTAASFAHPTAWRSLLQLATSIGPFLAGCAAMYLTYPVSSLLTLALSLPTGALLVRVFIVQHDCGHGSFFASRAANTAVGRLCSLITLTPFANWGRQHGAHHANWNNLDRQSAGSVKLPSPLKPTRKNSRRATGPTQRDLPGGELGFMT